MSTDPLLVARLPEVVVVSGASSGLGTAIASLLLEASVKVVGVDISDAVSTLDPAGYTHVRGDVGNEETWSRAVEVAKVFGGSSLGLVTAAAVLDVGTVLEMDRARMERTMSVNFMGTALAFQALIPAMLEHGGGPIVAVASIDATFAEQQLAVYAASKGAVRQLTRTVAMDHSRQGIRANVLSPGPMLAGLFERHMKSAVDPSRFLATRAARQPGGRILDPAEVARAALFLLSEASTALNGAEIIADGGLTTSFDFRTGTEGASV